MFLFGKIFTSHYLCYLATFAYQHTERLVLNKSRQPLLANNLKPIFSNAKERKFCIWGATGDAGWSQPAWDMYVWDDTALELGQAQLGAGSQYPRAGKALNCP